MQRPVASAMPLVALLFLALFAGRVFVPAAPGVGGEAAPAALRGAADTGRPWGQEPEAASESWAGCAPAAAALAGLGWLAAEASRGRRTARRAEPVSTAAAAAAAGKAAAGAAAGAKAAAAKGAVDAGAATVGSATLGSMSGKVKEGVASSDSPKADFDPAMQVGALPPLGFWDPAGFSKKGDESGFRNLRAAEIKHGRVAMMGALGAVVQHYVKFPGFEKVPAGLAAVTVPPGSYGMVALFGVAGILELGAWTESPDKEPGNFGDPLGLGQYDTDMRNREINNGRVAMFAVLGIIAAELLTGKDGVQQLGF